MRIAALDTTTPTASAAIWQDGQLMGQYTLQTTTHSTTVLPMMESLLTNLHIDVPDLDALAVSVGPGSFTGVRIGVATVKGLAFSHKSPCIGVSALEAPARNMRGFQGILCPVINARRNHVYTALFESDGIRPPKRITDDDQLPISEMPSQLLSFGKPIYGIGDGLTMLQNEMGIEHLAYTPETLRYPSAFGAACAAYEKYREASDPSVFTEAALLPLYLRKSQAEREREERLEKEQSNQKEL